MCMVPSATIITTSGNPASTVPSRCRSQSVKPVQLNSMPPFTHFLFIVSPGFCRYRRARNYMAAID